MEHTKEKISYLLRRGISPVEQFNRFYWKKLITNEL